MSLHFYVIIVRPFKMLLSFYFISFHFSILSKSCFDVVVVVVVVVETENCTSMIDFLCVLSSDLICFNYIFANFLMLRLTIDRKL